MGDRTIYEQFAAVAEELSFTAAANRLNMAQPWLSSRIRQFEKRLGLKLFIRTTSKVELTEQGRTLLPSAQAIARSINQFQEVRRTLADEPLPLRLGAPLYAGRIHLARKLFDAIRSHHPPLALEIDVAWNPTLMEKLADGVLDAVLTLCPEELEGYDPLVVAETTVEIEMDADDPLAAGEITPATLSGRTIKVFSRDAYALLYDKLFGPLREHGALLVEMSAMWSLNPGDVSEVPSLVAASSVLWAAPPRNGRIRRTVSGMPGTVPLCLLRRKGTPDRAIEMLWKIAASKI